MSIFKEVGKVVGSTAGRLGKEILKKRVETFDVRVVGAENLEELKDSSYLTVSNHLKPEEQMSSESGISPDAFIISKLIKEITNQEIKIVQKSDNGWWADSVFWRAVQKHVGQPFGRGLSTGIGNIPIQKNPGSSNREFLKIVEETVENNDPILIFPEGNWFQDFDISHNIQPGTAHLAKRHKLRIVPIYIYGATSWKEGQRVIVSIGKPFSTEELSKEQITQKIGEEIAKLQHEIRNFYS